MPNVSWITRERIGSAATLQVDEVDTPRARSRVHASARVGEHLANFRAVEPSRGLWGGEVTQASQKHTARCNKSTIHSFNAAGQFLALSRRLPSDSI